jgi:GT2 family glycosyltransferase/SAM-dependent methyltransferase
MFADPEFTRRVETGEVVNYQSAYWDSEITAADERCFGTSVIRVAEVFRMCRIPIRRFIDIGSGTGALLDALDRLMPELSSVFWGIEAFPPSAERHSRHPNYRIGTLADLSGTFDAGICVEVIEHLSPDTLRRLAAELAQRATPGALFLFNSGQPGFVENHDPGYLDPLGRGHIASYSIAGAAHIFNSCGFNIIALPGRDWAFLAEYTADRTAVDRDALFQRLWHPRRENIELLQSARFGPLIIGIGLEASRCYLEHSLVGVPASGPNEPDQGNAELTVALENTRRELTATTLQLRAMEQSTAWRATGPIRRAAMRYPHIARSVRRALRLARWTVTGQLPQRLRERRDARGYRRTDTPPPINIAPDAITLPRYDEPTVSVIIPTYGKADYVFRCLQSICQYLPSIPFEVLVAEDASGDRAIRQLRDIDNLRLIENARNLGFLLNCNNAASHAKGDFLLFLNNDTEVTPGWLDTLIDLLRQRQDAGAVGSKLLFPDGTLQEAGGIIWSDGSGWNYGRTDDPAKPVYNYVREADYVSGASLMVRRKLFQELGGFDPHFSPAYCEDSDLAFRIRAKGLKVLYQPRSCVTHFEGISHGTDPSAGIKSNQVANTRKLVERWHDALVLEHFQPGTHVMRARDRARDKRVVLVIDHYVPQPDRDAGSRTILAFMQALLNAGRVVKFWPANQAYSPGYTETVQDMGIEVCYGAAAASFHDWLRDNGAELDAVLLSRPTIADEFISPLRLYTRAKIVFYGHDLHFMRMRSEAVVTGNRDRARQADTMEQCERAVWRQVDMVLYPTTEEVDHVAAIAPGTLVQTVVPYAVDRFAQQRSVVAGSSILFVGGFAHPPNEDAAVWFVTEVLPRVQERFPSAQLSIVGSNPTATVRALAGAKVSIVANVTDSELLDYYSRARVAVVPLRFGAGLKLKVVEALKAGVPLVTTPVGAQGCPGLAAVAAIHNDAAQFADAVCTLLADDAAWAAVSARQVEYARAHFSEAELSRSLLAVPGL